MILGINGILKTPDLKEQRTCYFTIRVWTCYFWVNYLLKHFNMEQWQEEFIYIISLKIMMQNAKDANLYCADSPPNDEWSSGASYYDKNRYLKSDHAAHKWEWHWLHLKVPFNRFRQSFFIRLNPSDVIAPTWKKFWHFSVISFP